MCIGSLGSQASQPDYVDNVVFENITLTHSSNAAWIKTYPGTGHIKNVLFKDIRFTDVNQPIYISPCIYSGQNCDSSRLGISNIRWENISGTSRYNVGGGMQYVIFCSFSRMKSSLSGICFEDASEASLFYFQYFECPADVVYSCSSAAPCQNLTFSNIDIKPKNGGTIQYLCSNIANQKDMGLTCTGSCPANWAQQLTGNH